MYHVADGLRFLLDSSQQQQQQQQQQKQQSSMNEPTFIHVACSRSRRGPVETAIALITLPKCSRTARGRRGAAEGAHEYQ